MARKTVLLGSTGSIGTRILDAIDSRPDRFDVVGLAASDGNTDLLAGQAVRFQPLYVALARVDRAADLKHELAARGVEAPQLLIGPGAAAELAVLERDVVMNATTGAAGLKPTLVVLGAGLTLVLANKESLAIDGRLVIDLAAPGQLVAVDPEHSAFAQILRGGCRYEVARLTLIASGGPFRGHSRKKLADVTSEEVMVHPTWRMGRVITISSSILVNKELEFAETALSYGVGLDDIVVAVHPQSTVYSMVESTDGSTLAQASPLDMRLPIGLMLTWPDRLLGAAVSCDWTRSTTWTFEPLDDVIFLTVELARRARKAVGTVPAVYNAANEVLVDTLCDHRIGFLGITDLISRCLTEYLETGYVSDIELILETVLSADTAARERACELVEELS